MVGFLITSTEKYQWANWLLLVLSKAGIGILRLVKVNTAIAAWIFLNVVPGAGLGYLSHGPSLGYLIQASAKEETLAFEEGLFNFFRAKSLELQLVVLNSRIRKRAI